MTENTSLKEAKHVHFIGIGGIGVSAVARMMIAEGKRVSGSDISDSLVTSELRDLGAEIFIEETQHAGHIASDVDLVVYTVAIKDDNEALKEARTRSIETLSYPEVLGLVSQDKFTIAVCGTHGKTTTTAMIAKILIDADLDPTVIVGSMLLDHKSNFVAGKGNILVVEACEYKRSFLHINPSVIVITNIDEDHLDYYKDIDDIKSAFGDFVAKLGEDHHVVANLCQEATGDVVAATLANLHDYSLQNVDREIGVPGNHNYENAKAALAVADLLHIDRAQALQSLADFKGTWRRFEHKGDMGSTPVYDDYAHHPAEVAATLQAAREKFPGKKIVAVFQPHLYSRTKTFLNDFGDVFAAGADETILVPIYAAREKNDPSITSDMLAGVIVEKGGKAEAVSGLEDAVVRAREIAKEGSVVLAIGAGDIYKVAEDLVSS